MSLGSSVASFALVAGLVTVIPGLDTAMVLRSAIRDGRPHGFATALGISCGALVWGAGAAVGITALLEISTVAYTAVRIAGACYMIWLGSRLLAQALQTKPAAEAPSGTDDTEPRGLRRSWARGFMTNLLNPKIGAFYVAVMPQFIPTHASHLAVGLLLASVHDAEGLVWFSGIILLAHRARQAFSRRRTQRAIDGVTGSVLIGLGVKLGLSSR
jgi:threonine/homoserine/homoserine lactone efflux protein